MEKKGEHSQRTVEMWRKMKKTRGKWGNQAKRRVILIAITANSKKRIATAEHVHPKGYILLNC